MDFNPSNPDPVQTTPELMTDNQLAAAIDQAAAPHLNGLDPLIIPKHAGPDGAWAMLGHVWFDPDMSPDDQGPFPTRRAAHDDWFVRKFCTTAAQGLPRTPNTDAFMAALDRLDLSVEGPEAAFYAPDTRKRVVTYFADLALASALKQAEAERLHQRYLTLTRGVSDHDRARLADAGLEVVGRVDGSLIVGVN